MATSTSQLMSPTVGILYKEIYPPTANAVLAIKAVMKQDLEQLSISSQNRNWVGNPNGLGFLARVELEIEQLKGSVDSLQEVNREIKESHHKLEDSHCELKGFVRNLEEWNHLLKGSVDNLRKSNDETNSFSQSLQEYNRQLDRANGHLKDRLDNFQRYCNLYHGDTLELRRFELWSYSATDFKSSKARLVRNAMVHGGNVLLDAEICRQEENQHPIQHSMYNRILSGFETLYGISYPTYIQSYSNAPAVIREALNIRANLTHIRDWKQRPHAKRSLLGLCNEILKDWIERHPSDDEIAQRFYGLKYSYNEHLSQMAIAPSLT